MTLKRLKQHIFILLAEGENEVSADVDKGEVEDISSDLVFYPLRELMLPKSAETRYLNHQWYKTK